MDQRQVRLQDSGRVEGRSAKFGVDAQSINSLSMKILIILGYSGVGKSTFGHYLEKEKGWLHIEFDPKSETFNLKSFAPSPSHNKFTKDYFENLKVHLSSKGYGGAVLTMPSYVVFDEKASNTLHTWGVDTIYFVAPPHFCLEQFLVRENKIARGFNAYHWMKHNMSMCKFLTSQISSDSLRFVDVTNGSDRLFLNYVYKSIFPNEIAPNKTR